MDTQVDSIHTEARSETRPVGVLMSTEARLYRCIFCRQFCLPTEDYEEAIAADRSYSVYYHTACLEQDDRHP